MSLLQGHWYTPEGQPYIETIESVEQVKDLGLLPSVTTILKICHNHSLSQWITNTRDKAWFELERFPHETLKDAKARVNAIAGKKSNTAKEKGSFVHAVAENYWNSIFKASKLYQHLDSHNDYEMEVLKTITTIHKEMFPKFTPHGIETILTGNKYAGKIDLYGSIGTKTVLIDYKTQTLKKGADFFVYPSYWAQGAAYAALIPFGYTSLPYECSTVFIILIDPVTLKWKVDFQTDRQFVASHDSFINCLHLFRGPMGLGL